MGEEKAVLEPGGEEERGGEDEGIEITVDPFDTESPFEGGT